MYSLAAHLKSSPLPLIMGIVNATPDSFSDTGRDLPLAPASERALKLVDEGADIIDVGGESTRPGAAEVPVEQEIARVLPVVRTLKKLRPSAVISIDTRKSPVAKAALEAGAEIINDVSGLQFSPDLAEIVAAFDAALVLMHMRGTPETMRSAEHCCYESVVCEVSDFLRAACRRALECGVKRENLCCDPGLGFAKTPEQDFELLRSIPDLAEIAPVLIGHSRKSFLGKYLGLADPAERIAATLGVSLFAAQAGAAVLRVHDVRWTREALQAYFHAAGRI